MTKFSRSCLVAILLSGSLGFVAACGNRAVVSSVAAPQSAQAVPTASPTTAAKPAGSAKPKVSPAPAANLPDTFKLALDKAASAKSISQSAQSPDDWALVASRWQQAIGLLKKVPATSPNRKQVKARLAEYQQKLAYARKQAQLKDDLGGSSGILIDPVADGAGTIAAEIPLSSPNRSGVYRATIKYRRGGIPVINVMFNGRHSFDMMVDTGASGTMITQEMASIMGIEVVGQVPIGTAAGKAMASVGYVQSIAAGGAMIKNVPVTIGPVEIGLLGHDFFGDCDINIKRDVVEFRNCGA
jgi:predicted aspartyl protease